MIPAGQQGLENPHPQEMMVDLPHRENEICIGQIRHRHWVQVIVDGSILLT
jgi:hypothetical protein